ncbi:MAG: terminase large subunit [Acidobacteriota bacterium]|nr:terminase large subunit [Acidobacteriota bacterium]
METIVAVATPEKPKVASPVTTYAQDVVDGKIVAGKMVRQACKRHLDDLKRKDIDFKPEDAQFALDFFNLLSLTEGEFAGKPFKLEPFQQFIVGSLFGWKGSDGYRRFRTAYIELGKGNGKSPMAAGIGLLGLVADGEPGAEVYAAAVTRDQAKILFSDAEKMVEKSPSLSGIIESTVNNLSHGASQSFFRAISAEARGLDGKRVHMALIDEVHEHPTPIVVDKMRAGTKNRRQALIFEITNSGYDRNSVCYDHHRFSEQILEGSVKNDEWFAYVAQIDEGDSWTDEKVWPKANPGLDTILPRKYLREQVAEAIGMPSKQNIVLRLNFCVWTEQATRWLDMDQWDLCADKINAAALAGKRKCWAGVDLSATTDLSALALVFEPDDQDIVDVLMYYWVPEERMRERAQRDRVPYDRWVREGFIEMTEGNVVDYDAIRERVNGLRDFGYNIAEVAMDPWNATQTSTQLQGDGFEVAAIRQGFASLTAPSKELERRVAEKSFRHGGNPVLRWNASNVAVAQDPAGNIKPDKARSTERIDGIAAIVNGLARMLFRENTNSVYEERGVLSI